MPIERETITERTVPGSTTAGGGSSLALIGGVVVVLAAVMLVLWFMGVFNGAGPVTVNVPEVTVTP